MTTTTKTLLTLSLVGLLGGLMFVTGFIDAGNMTAFYIVFPAGAILFGLFLISKLLEKETAAYDKEQQAAILAAERAIKPASAPPSKPAHGSRHAHA